MWWNQPPAPVDTGGADDVTVVLPPADEPGTGVVAAPDGLSVTPVPATPEAAPAAASVSTPVATPEPATASLPPVTDLAQAPATEASRRGDGGHGARSPRLAIGVGLVLVAVALLWLVNSAPFGGSGAGNRSTAPHLVDPASITAVASSTQNPEGAVSYGPGNTLDGDPSTAWNSNGHQAADGGPLTLTYTFPAPVDLASITIRNGYQKVRSRAGRADLDLYPLNQRVKELTVVTDKGRFTWSVADSREPQTFTGARGRTRSVSLQVAQVYRSTQYRDVAISEVGFTATG